MSSSESLRTEILNTFDALVDTIESYYRLNPSRACSISKTHLETAKLWFAETPLDEIIVEDDSNG